MIRLRNRMSANCGWGLEIEVFPTIGGKSLNIGTVEDGLGVIWQWIVALPTIREIGRVQVQRMQV